MDEERLPLRIRVIVVSTRVAATSLERRGLDTDEAVRRGILLLDALRADVRAAGLVSDGVQRQIEDGRAELVALLREPVAEV